MAQSTRAAELIRGAQAAGRNLLEHEALQLLAEYGFPLPRFEVLPYGKQVSSEYFAGLSYPLVVKAVSPQIVHKTEAGAICLNIQDEKELREAIRDMETSINERAPQAVIEGWLVRPYVPEGTEIIAGSIIDPQFGPTVMVGVGGVLTEVYRDVTFRLVPLSAADAEEMIGDLKAQALLDGVRGLPPVSRVKLAELIVRLSTMVEELPDILECDLNPVICQGESVTVADVRVKLKEQ
jgi:succinyl-CoA synthetase beta subunit